VIYKLPNCELKPEAGSLSCCFLERKCSDYHSACEWLKNLPYGRNSSDCDSMILFDEGFGTCITKHGIAARLAEELGLDIHRYEGLYRMDASIVPYCAEVLKQIGWPYIPNLHCFLKSGTVAADLTEGNCHGKTMLPLTYDIIVRVPADQPKEDHRALYLWGIDHLCTLDPFWQDIPAPLIYSTLQEIIEAGHTCST